MTVSATLPTPYSIKRAAAQRIAALIANEALDCNPCHALTARLSPLSPPTIRLRWT